MRWQAIPTAMIIGLPPVPAVISSKPLGGRIERCNARPLDMHRTWVRRYTR